MDDGSIIPSPISQSALAGDGEGLWKGECWGLSLPKRFDTTKVGGGPREERLREPLLGSQSQAEGLVWFTSLE